MNHTPIKKDAVLQRLENKKRAEVNKGIEVVNTHMEKAETLPVEVPAKLLPPEQVVVEIVLKSFRDAGWRVASLPCDCPKDSNYIFE